MTVGCEHSILAGGETREDAGPETLTKLLSDSIGEVLIDLVGTRVRESIYNHLEKNRSIARSEIPHHLDEFFKVFERTFGVASKKVIERAIARKVYSKLGWGFQPIRGFELTDYLDRIKTGFTKRSATEHFP